MKDILNRNPIKQRLQRRLPLDIMNLDLSLGMWCNDLGEPAQNGAWEDKEVIRRMDDALRKIEIPPHLHDQTPLCVLVNRGCRGDLQDKGVTQHERECLGLGEGQRMGTF